MKHRIPFNKPFIVGKELDYIAQAVTQGQISGDGPFTKKCCRVLEEEYDIGRVLLTPSCTAALELAALLCDIGPGDEVILPSFTFVSTANAFVRLGAKPVFADIREDTLNLDEEAVAAAMTSATRVICPVHYAGVSCEMDPIMEHARSAGVRVVEDAAQGVNARYRDRPLGSIGDLGTFSFHETKNYISGEGGALCINDPALVERAEILREKGTNRSKFLRGQVDKYTWVDVGSSYIPSEIVSAFLYGQLEARHSIAERRREIHERYLAELSPLEARGDLRLPRIPPHCQHNHHLFYIVLASEEARDRMITHLGERGIQAVFHYVPLHTSPVGKGFGYREGDLPVTEDLSRRLLRLPFYFELEEVDQAEVVAAIRDFFSG